MGDEEILDLISEDKESLSVNNFKIWKLMRDMSFIDNKDLTMTELALKLEINRFHPYYNFLLAYLIDNSIIRITKIVGKRKYIKIDKKKLKKEIESNEIWKIFAEYVHENKLLYANI